MVDPKSSEAWTANIYRHIGQLVVSWANTESRFLHLLQQLRLAESFIGNLIWESQRSDDARLTLVLRFARARITDAAFLKEVRCAITEFRELTQVRNHYSHCLYHYDSEGRLIGTFSVSMPRKSEEPMKPQAAPLDQSSIDNLALTVTKLIALNNRVQKLAERLSLAVPAPRGSDASPPPAKSAPRR